MKNLRVFDTTDREELKKVFYANKQIREELRTEIIEDIEYNIVESLNYIKKSDMHSSEFKLSRGAISEVDISIKKYAPIPSAILFVEMASDLVGTAFPEDKKYLIDDFFHLVKNGREEVSIYKDTIIPTLLDSINTILSDSLFKIKEYGLSDEDVFSIAISHSEDSFGYYTKEHKGEYLIDDDYIVYIL